MLLFFITAAVMAAVDLNAAIAVIFGVGGAGAVTAAVAAYRRIKSGKISDDESVIKRLYAELARKDQQLIGCGMEMEVLRRRANFWEEQAVRYRLQIVAAEGTPVDMEKPSGI